MVELLNKEKDLKTGVTGVLCAVCCLLSWRYPPFYVVNTNKIDLEMLIDIQETLKTHFFPYKPPFISNIFHLEKWARSIVGFLS